MKRAPHKTGRPRGAARSLFGGCAVALVVVLAATVLFLPSARAALRTGWGLLLAYEPSTGVLTVSPDGEHLFDVVYTDKTVTAPAPDPHGFPPGPCKRYALDWNAALFASSEPSTFRALLADMAAKKCPVGYVTVSAPNPDGSTDLASLAPAKP